MRLKISTQPISTSRSPRNGSRPVVSVSSTISRINSCPGNDESGSPLRHLSSLLQNVPDPCAYRLKTIGCIHHEIGAGALFRVGQLPREDGVELFAGYVVTRQDSLALNFA